MDNKIAPAHNYLTRIVATESKEALAEVLKRPGAALQLVGKVNDIYAPELEIEVKNWQSESMKLKEMDSNNI